MLLDKIAFTNTYSGQLTAPGSGTVCIHIEISYDADNHVLVVNWEGEPCSAEIRRGYTFIMEEVRKHKPKKVLLDLQRRCKISRCDQRWVFTTIFPQLLRILEHDVFVAVVLPVMLYTGLVAEMDGDELMYENNFLIIHHCLYREEAYRWLNNMHTEKKY